MTQTNVLVVATPSHLDDVRGSALAQTLREDLHLPVEAMRIASLYTIHAPLTPADLEDARQHLFTDAVVQTSFWDARPPVDCHWIIQVGFLPGTTDNVGRTATEALEDIRQQPLDGAVYHSQLYLLRGNLAQQDVERVVRDALANPLIHQWRITAAADWRDSKNAFLPAPIAGVNKPPQVSTMSLDADDVTLAHLSQERLLSLNIDEMKAIQTYFRTPEQRQQRQCYGLGADPTDVELEALAQTWSEHCKHKIFNSTIHYRDADGTTSTLQSLFKSCIVRATEEIGQRVDWLLSVFHDNAGVIRFNDQWNLVMKVETHNTPSALDPYGGAITGILGVNRDPFGTGKGCKLLFNTDVLCFAPPDYDEPLPPRLLHPKRVFKGVHRGIKDGANQSGVPDVNGAVVFDERFLGKPLVFCGTGGLMPAQIGGEPSYEKQANPGDLIVMTGGRIGKDGIHGATFSSQELSEVSPASAVQIGDSITQKKMTDFLLEARDQQLYTCITDNGAGGLSSSVGEMARFSNGCELHLDRAPLKYPGLDPWEILVSESQERMTLAVPPTHINAFLALAQRRHVEATVLGTFTDSGWFHILHDGETVALLQMDFLHDGVPDLHLEAHWQPPRHPEPVFPCPDDLTESLLNMLGRLNICSKEWVIRQYDHEVQAMSVIKPLVGAQNDGPSDAAVLRPLLDAMEGVIVANGICPRYSDIDTYHMAANAIDEAIRNVIAVGGRLGHIAGLDNFCWPDPELSASNPDGPYKMAQLVRANQALYDYCTAYDVPCISGKDSMKNDYHIGDTKISVPPTLLFSVIARMPDVRKAITMDVKQPGDLVFILGETRAELGASEYYAMHGAIGNRVPQVDAQRARVLYEALADAMERGLVSACHDCSDGGFGVAAAEMAFAGGCGMQLDLRAMPREADINRDDTLLYAESASRLVVTVPPRHREMFLQVMSGCAIGELGQVIDGSTFTVTGLRGEVVIQSELTALKTAWQRPLATL
ncbi:MAG: phosphoribosylformylglycinamidine synthase [Candidatus Entotheonella factor]|uniref:Phosphoribosylformylglycinamidine synthase subunit PurL n=1 Tax=Entotheonella factor TaxID=1429438 RepID=W4LYR6_ENTF1|nr:AIR synthase-related protein [Candidatus Entotheonella palauensis]ETX02517.1 MAG: phosphoribosylformylglycinamidine synthase [Candidatus Entotheonella factor]